MRIAMPSSSSRYLVRPFIVLTVVFAAVAGLEPVWRAQPTLMVASVAALCGFLWSLLEGAARNAQTPMAPPVVAEQAPGCEVSGDEREDAHPEPAAVEPDAPPVAAATEPDAIRPTFRICVADDSRAGRLALGLAMARAGYCVERSAADPEAMPPAGACDLVLLDVDLAADPTTLCQEVRARVGEARVVALTSDPGVWAEDRLLEAGVDRAVAKPVDCRALLDLVAAFAEPLAAADDEPAEDPFIDHAALRALEKLADRAFVAEIVSEFSAEAAVVLSSLTKAVAERDAVAFANQVHALRSSAANVGATGVYRLCLSWRETSAKELAATGLERLHRLREEFARTCAALDAYVEASEQTEGEPGQEKPAPMRLAG